MYPPPPGLLTDHNDEYEQHRYPSFVLRQFIVFVDEFIGACTRVLTRRVRTDVRLNFGNVCNWMPQLLVAQLFHFAR